VIARCAKSRPTPASKLRIAANRNTLEDTNFY
jgi:hypothetical protein